MKRNRTSTPVGTRFWVSRVYHFTTKARTKQIVLYSKKKIKYCRILISYSNVFFFKWINNIYLLIKDYTRCIYFQFLVSLKRGWWGLTIQTHLLRISIRGLSCYLYIYINSLNTLYKYNEGIRYWTMDLMESLILAQDERWRHA